MLSYYIKVSATVSKLWSYVSR